eukprot:GHVN01014479.1.p1 GENE.GHVN01014479.1~~GHVN01014479.1.p1  ORF type:complete len:132 (+),score=18.94 GHVN01014479.1:357-752(+)
MKSFAVSSVLLILSATVIGQEVDIDNEVVWNPYDHLEKPASPGNLQELPSPLDIVLFGPRQLVFKEKTAFSPTYSKARPLYSKKTALRTSIRPDYSKTAPPPVYSKQGRYFAKITSSAPLKLLGEDEPSPH